MTSLTQCIACRCTITKPSRITSHSATIIDNIFTNMMGNQIISGLLICEVTDHLPVFTLYDCNLKKTKDTMAKISTRKITEDMICALNNSLALQDWTSVYRESNVDSAYCNFLDIFTSLHNKHCPVKEYTI